MNTHLALCPGEYDFEIKLEETGEETYIATAGGAIDPLIPEEEFNIIGGGEAAPVNSDSASVNWETNKSAQCRLVYDTESH